MRAQHRIRHRPRRLRLQPLVYRLHLHPLPLSDNGNSRMSLARDQLLLSEGCFFLAVCLSVYLSICLSICLSVYLSVCLTLCLYVCLCM
jgi:hypothetical protein